MIVVGYLALCDFAGKIWDRDFHMEILLLVILTVFSLGSVEIYQATKIGKLLLGHDRTGEH